jgi:hypothetical protein
VPWCAVTWQWNGITPARRALTSVEPKKRHARKPREIGAGEHLIRTGVAKCVRGHACSLCLRDGHWNVGRTNEVGRLHAKRDRAANRDLQPASGIDRHGHERLLGSAARLLLAAAVQHEYIHLHT